MDRQCPSCGGLCKRSGCERENVMPRREWVSLTDDEFEEILKELSHAPRLLAVEIEARLTEKNI